MEASSGASLDRTLIAPPQSRTISAAGQGRSRSASYDATGTARLQSNTSSSPSTSSEFRVEIRLESCHSTATSSNGDGPAGQRIDMLGTARTGSRYSLAGNVLLHVPSPPIGALRSTFKLSSFTLAFEGKTEYWDNEGRYEELKVIDVRKDLLPDDNAREVIGGSTYALAFDLAVPGWLPCTYESTNVSTSYGLSVRATIDRVVYAGGAMAASVPVPIAGERPTPSPNAPTRLLPRLARTFGFASLCPSTSCSPEFIASTFVPIVINRHRIQRVPPDSESVYRHFSLCPDPSLTISPVECVVSVPEVLDILGDSLRVSVRLRAKPIEGEDVNMDGGPAPVVRVVEIGIEIEECIKTR